MLIHNQLEKRALGYLETFFVERYSYDELSDTGYLFRCDFRGVLQLSLFKQAVEHVFHTHPILHARLIEEADKYYFRYDVAFSEIKIKQYQLESKETLCSIIEQEMNSPLNIHQCLWRVNLLSDGEKHVLLVTTHHACMDGLSTIQFLKDLFSANARLQKGEALDACLTQPVGAIEKYLGHLVKPGASSSSDAFSNDFNGATRFAFKYHNYVPTKQRQTRLIFRAIDISTLEAIKQKPKARRLTDNSILQAVYLKSLVLLEQRTLDTILHTPINLKAYAKPKIDPDYIGNFASVVTTIHSDISEESSIYDIARDYQKKLKQAIHSYLAKEPPNIKDSKEMFSQLLADNKESFKLGLNLSYFGKLNLQKQYGGIELAGYYTLPIRKLGINPVLVIIYVLGDKICFCFCTVSPLVSEKYAETFVETYLYQLHIESGNVTYKANL